MNSYFAQRTTSMSEAISSKRVATRKFRRMAVALGATIAMAIGLVLAFVAPANAAPPAPKTIVSLTFDDGHASQQVAFDTMKQYGMLGTFYMNSGFVGGEGFFTLDQVKAIAAYGNEIGSHTISHPDLTAISADEASRQICNDRVNWAAWGIPTSNFAYPFASENAAVETLVKNCGDNSARGLGDVKTRFSCPACPVAETIPPLNAYNTRAPDQVETTWTLADLKTSVTQAEATGGWVQLTFHDICDGCPAPAMSPAVFQQFIKWLAPRASRGTVVQRVQDVIGGVVAPVVAGPVAPEAAAGINGVKNPSLETFDAATGLPQGFIAAGYGSNTPTWAVTTAAHTGTSAVTMTMANYVDGAARLMPTLDLGQYAPTVTAGKTYDLSAWYTSTVTTQFDLYYRTALGTWAYWTSSPLFAPTASYTEAKYTTPAVPAGATAISFGLNLISNGSVTVDDLSMISTSAVAPAALRAATALNTLVVAGASGTDTPSITDDPIVKGDDVTKHFEVPSEVALPVVPDLLDPGKTFVISPELIRG
jgi:peptidoglycan/xylan/chitin deacetylase (PgdA/CDA1 family)